MKPVVIKRNNQIVEFNRERIEKAIYEALNPSDSYKGEQDGTVDVLNEVIQKTLRSINAVHRLCDPLPYNYKMRSIFLRQVIVTAVLNQIRMRESWLISLRRLIVSCELFIVRPLNKSPPAKKVFLLAKVTRS
ncbi:ATP cone domain-containing protein [Vibrio diabolicus]|uniref:ATP cone domain-containing protein n=1 Tax=Vibrio diabolicus TaxID=50719 RepID=UPI003752A55B